MSQPPRPLGPIPIRTADAPLRALSPPPGLDPEPDRPPSLPVAGPGRSRGSRGLSAGLVYRAVRRHWIGALATWALGSAGLVALADRQIRPHYEAASTIKVEPGDRDQFRDGGPGGDFEVFKQTQARRVTNPNVIASALKDHPELIRLPTLAKARDPEAAVRAAMSVQVVPNTNLIQVAMTSPSADDPARVVDAVIGSFLRTASDGEEAAKRGQRLRDAKRERTEAVERKRAAIVALAGRLGAIDGARARDRDAVALEQYKTLSKQLLQTELDLMAAQTRLDQLRDGAATTDADPARLEAAVVAAFYADPQVAAVRAQIDAARDELAQAERVARNAGDPARVSARKAGEEAQRQLDGLWIKKKPALTKTVRASSPRDAEARQAASAVAELKAMAARLNERLDRLNLQTRSAGEDELTLEFARQDLARAETMLDSAARGLDQHEIDAKGPVARFQQEFPARVADSPDADRRVRAMTLAPFGMLLGVVGFLVLAELRSGRVVGPDDLPMGLRPRVLGVVPIRPRSGASGHLSPGRRDDFERFVQSLDHLRVVLCDRRDDRGRRVLLITSACGGEGKTTLAAQLAERCVNAGLGTLLIDADLRNPSLSRMFDHATSRGMADVLRGEATAEEAITVIGDAGGVHFLPAGTDRSDPGRLLHGERLGRFLARARESFDIVIVDAPPVLPVPDALTIGRWVDGAVLAVRSDASRFPLVEQADHRLAAMGVPVLGAVVNGVRDAAKAYGGAYGPARGPADIVTTLDA
jgi:succinoglycan biosynthesis transport protein ExoP